MIGPMRDAAAQGHLALQYCVACSAVQYPPRQVCHVCLSERLEWRTSDRITGTVLACTVLHHSHDAQFRNALPLRLALVQIGGGPIALCFRAGNVRINDTVTIISRLDDAGRPILIAR